MNKKIVPFKKQGDNKTPALLSRACLLQELAEYHSVDYPGGILPTPRDRFEWKLHFFDKFKNKRTFPLFLLHKDYELGGVFSHTLLEQDDDTYLGIPLFVASDITATYYLMLVALYRALYLTSSMKLQFMGASPMELLERPAVTLEFPEINIRGIPNWPNFEKGYEPEIPAIVRDLARGYGVRQRGSDSISSEEGITLFVRMLLTSKEMKGVSTPLEAALKKFTEKLVDKDGRLRTEHTFQSGYFTTKTFHKFSTTYKYADKKVLDNPKSDEAQRIEKFKVGWKEDCISD